MSVLPSSHVVCESRINSVTRVSRVSLCECSEDIEGVCECFLNRYVNESMAHNLVYPMKQICFF